MSNKQKKIKIGITIGDINGIGPEVIMKSLSDSRINNFMTPVIYGSTKTLSYYRKSLNINDFNYAQVKKENEIIDKKVNVVNCWEETIEINVGESTQKAGFASFKALKKATDDLKEGVIDCIVTAPINKSNIQNEEFNFTGHTDFLTKTFEAEESLMMLVSESLRVGLVTEHIPLKDVSKAITNDKLAKKYRIMERSLKNDFGISKPKIAVLGLNPHAGDNGLLGEEDGKVIEPFINDLKNEGKLASGPYSPDGFFASGQHKRFDGILCMYHDQGLIPFKLLAFEDGVNFTAGLPIVRTSPDHGTAYAIAGKNSASEVSMRQALFLAVDIAKKRNNIE
ncbi:MAG: 4-hydroxythreonine-4-phosphate dehydrogenase PdxA [Bacteroidota bacterium]